MSKAKIEGEIPENYWENIWTQFKTLVIDLVSLVKEVWPVVKKIWNILMQIINLVCSVIPVVREYLNSKIDKLKAGDKEISITIRTQ